MTNEKLLLKALQEADFCMIDVGLYLDTHPECQHGLEYFRKIRQDRQTILKELEAIKGPMTMDSSLAEGKWEWTNGPWPWELED